MQILVVTIYHMVGRGTSNCFIGGLVFWDYIKFQNNWNPFTQMKF